jgi:citrate synthase
MVGMKTSEFSTAVSDSIPKAKSILAWLRDERAADTIGPLTLTDALGGLPGLPVLLSLYPGGLTVDLKGQSAFRPPHRVDSKLGMFIGNRSIAEILLEQRSFEWFVATMFLGDPPNPAVESSVVKELASARGQIVGTSGAWRSFAAQDRAIWFIEPFRLCSAFIGELDQESLMHRLTVADRAPEISPATRLSDSLTTISAVSLAFVAWYRRVVLEMKPEDAYRIETYPTKGVSEFLVANMLPGASVAQQQLTTRAVNLVLGALVYHGPGNLSTECGKICSTGGATSGAIVQAMIAGLSGSKHGLAAELSLRFLVDLFREGRLDPATPVEAQMRTIVRDRITAGKDIFGVGHRIVETDFRTVAMFAFLKENFPEDEHVKHAETWFAVAVDELEARAKSHGKALRCGANVDSYSGLLLLKSGLVPNVRALSTISGFFTLSRTVGTLAESYWDWAAFGKPPLIRLGHYQAGDFQGV